MATNIEVYNARRKQNTIARTQLDRKSSHSSPNATTPKPSVGKHSASTSAKPDLKDQQRMKAVIAKYQQILADEHAYIVIHALRAARYVVNNRYSGSPEAEKRASLIDDSSPFKDMPAIDTIPASTAGTVLKEKDLTKGRFTVRNYSKANSSGTEIKLQVKGHVAPSPSAKGIPRLPKYHAYTTLRNNILAEDDEFMRYFPYFGEEIDENDVFDMLNLEEAFVDRTKNAQEENMRAEKGIVFVDYIDRFLKDLDLDMNAITNYLIGDLTHTNWPHSRKKNREKYLPEDFDHTETKVQSAKKKLTPVSMAELERAEILCSVFWDIMDFSLWEVAKRADEGVKESMAPARISGGNQGSASKMPGGKVAAAAIAAMTGGNPQPYSLESYAALNCLYCYMHECPFHVNTSKDSLFLSSNGNTPLPTTTSGSRKHAFAEGAECSKGCFIKASDEDRAKKTVWTKAQMQLLQASAVVLRENPRASCLMACVINKYCYEVEAELQRQGLLSVPPELPPAVAAIEPPNQKGLKRKRTTKQYEYTDCQRTSHASMRTYFKPCMHTGPCTSECPCVMEKVMCEKSCFCEADCPRRFRGCTCAASGKACTQNTNCPCVKWNRECDPDLCTDCGAAETLSPSNRYNEELAKECCQNVALQRDVPRRTLLGISGVSGLGLFIGESVKKDTFLGEYKGEVITHEEAERRGKLYDKRGVSFLFNLNRTQVIDATRAGNKFRFVNHYKKPNCFAKVLFANCIHRIGMFAKRDLVAGEELYFDYGYNNKSVQFIAQEPEFIYEPSVEKAPPARKRNMGNRGNWNTGVTARTLKTKQLKELDKMNGANGTASHIHTATLPIGGRNRNSTSDFNFGETNGSYSNGFHGSLSTTANTPSVTDGVSDTPGADDGHTGRNTHRSDDEDSDDEPIQGRVRGRSRSRPTRMDSRIDSRNMWEVDGSDEEGDEDDEGDHESNERAKSEESRGDADDDEDDEDEDEEDEYAPTREVARQRRRDRATSAATAAGKRRKLVGWPGDM